MGVFAAIHLVVLWSRMLPLMLLAPYEDKDRYVLVVVLFRCRVHCRRQSALNLDEGLYACSRVRQSRQAKH
jgi:hypothetical protein